jgi:DNA-binding Lrp family transcriptional regulator
MVRVKSVQMFKGEPADLEARMISAIGMTGPRNVAQIARLTGAHQETIRYKIKKRFVRLGFRFHAEVDFAKLGLTLHWATLDFSKAYNEMAPRVLTALNEVGYLAYFAKLIPQGNYIALFTPPANTSGKYEEFLGSLREKGVLDGFELTESLARRHQVMDPRFFNFRSGRWEIEWAKVAAAQSTALVPGKKPKIEEFDYTDLLVIKELQKDARQHLTGIAKEVKVNQKTLEYHFRAHIQKWKLVPSYSIRWAQDVAKRPIHSTVFTRLAFHNLTKSEFVDVQAAISKVPLLWTEYLLRDGTYLATMYIPLTDLVGVSNYVSNAVPGLGAKAEMSFIDFANASSFTIPYNMYHDGNWKFDVGRMATALRKHSTITIEK